MQSLKKEASLLTSLPQGKVGKRKRGREQVERILSEAQSLLIAQGYASLTIRQVARNLDISLGNLTYYFPTKDALLKAMIADMIDKHLRLLEKEQESFPAEPEGRFLAYLGYLFEECKKHEVRSFFFQIWGMSTHNKMVHGLRDDIYRHFRKEASRLIEPLHSGIGAADLDARAAGLIAFIEGLHVIFDFDCDVLGHTSELEQALKAQAFRIAAL